MSYAEVRAEFKVQIYDFDLDGLIEFLSKEIAVP
jgi:hypothetical protein